MSSASQPAGTTTAAPKLSASVVIVNSKNEILLVQRTPESRAYGGVTVFPGGNFDAEEDASLGITAIRETFEESGLLLAKSGHTISDAILDRARQAVYSRKTRFSDFMTQHGLEPDVASLLTFTQWVTPVDAPMRFRTQFYVAFLPASSSGFSSGFKQERVPKPDGGIEVVSTHFVHPSAAIEECRKGTFTFMPPQFYIVTTLAGILQGSQTTHEQRAQIEALSNGAFGQMVINPKRLQQRDSDGCVIFAYEGDETRGGSSGRRHRTLAPVRNNKFVTKEIRLERNFDIFSEIEANVFSMPSKL
ncbi:hypothetical protein HGRIS_012984 [Hohenbuehelia grisea]|uniref:Nudix hydrolase domain-containing protein n=1 Tax=Hohenbuehelia grisea TaxID=104357 RepID=A0ABR3IUC6_9AGAR